MKIVAGERAATLTVDVRQVPASIPSCWSGWRICSRRFSRPSVGDPAEKEVSDAPVRCHRPAVSEGDHRAGRAVPRQGTQAGGLGGKGGCAVPGGSLPPRGRSPAGHHRSHRVLTPVRWRLVTVGDRVGPAGEAVAVRSDPQADRSAAALARRGSHHRRRSDPARRRTAPEPTQSLT
jgi:hypothetical protein